MASLPRTVGWSTVDVLIDDSVATCAERSGRWILGVTGPPASGKSSLARRVVDRAAAEVLACVAPMDGFHRSNDELEAMGLLELKGVPASFDGESFVSHLEQLRRPDPVSWPTFDRSREEAVPGGQLIDVETQLVVVEGNYLLLDTDPWDRIRHLLDEVWYLDVPEEVLIPRLRARHELARTPEEAWAKVQSTDLPNAQLVAPTRDRADVVIT
jgi:pantothenate kinase